MILKEFTDQKRLTRLLDKDSIKYKTYGSSFKFSMTASVGFKMVEFKSQRNNTIKYEFQVDKTSIPNEQLCDIIIAFVDDTDLVTAANDTHTSGETMIEQMQALMTDWCSGIRAMGGLIVPTKTRWFAIAFWFDGVDWQYHTTTSLPGDITLLHKDGNIYTVSREEPSKAFKSLGLRIDFSVIPQLLPWMTSPMFAKNSQLK